MQESLEEQQHQADTTQKCTCGKQVEEMHGKNIHNSEQLKSQMQKQSQYQKSMDQTLNAKMRDENNEHFQTRPWYVQQSADLQHARMAKEVTQSSLRPSGKRHHQRVLV